MNIWSHMGHPADGEWRAYRDGEVSEARHQALDRHLERCFRCRSRLTEIQESAGFAAARLGALRAVAEVAPVPPMPERPSPLRIASEEGKPMTRFRITGRMAAGAVAAAMAVSLFFPGVRTAAADFVTVFRVKEAKVIRINPADLQNLDKNGGLNLAGIDPAKLAGLIQIEDSPALTPPQEDGLTLDELKKRGFKPPTWLPDRYEPTAGAFFGERAVKLKVDVDGVNQLLGLLGTKERLPKELKGETITITSGPGLVMGYVNLETKTNLMVSQGQALSFSATGRADVKKVTDVLMAVLGEQSQLPESLRAQLKGLDLTSTLPLPVVEGQSYAVQVRGIDGVYQPVPNGGGGMLTWVENGTVHVIGAFGQTVPGLSDLRRIAESLGR